MPDTRYLRERTTRSIDDTTLAAIAAQIVGPPGQLGHLPPNPARFRLHPLHPPARRGLLLAGGSLLLLTLWAGVISPGVPAVATARYLAPATATITRTVRPTTIRTATATATTTATATYPPTATAGTTASATATTTATATASPTLTVRPTMPARPTLRPVTRPVSPPPPTPTRLPLPVATVAPPTVLPPFPATPGSGAAGNDWDSSVYSRSATIHAAPTATP